ncbi:hypothetical protein Cantr_07307 [Candida viswanathii]|uniref:Uncharacterized protein n=1 Tax=Candida viswanathii TaxID=5486 RepID=A0A367Y1J5_9ASCO|nr:hypothetical protein Cantr_07307 [Candida viswanathii]
MRYDELAESLQDTKKKPTFGNENEMIILMRNMNKLSSKMMSMSSMQNNAQPEESVDGLSANEVNEYQEELDLHDLNEIENLQYIKLNINPDVAKGVNLDHGEDGGRDVSKDEMSNYLQSQLSHGQIELRRRTFEE